MRKALIVGIDNYPSAPLSGCHNDAQALAERLKRNENQSVNFSINLQYDIKGKGDLKHHIDDCFSSDAEVALFYFSGHGFIDSFGGYLVTPDFNDHDMGVSMQEVLWVVNQSRCKNKVIIFDCCYAGFMGSAIPSERQTSIIGEGVTILTACRTEQTALEQDGHGLFTSLLLSALDGGASDITGNITLGGIYAYIDKALDPFKQRPVFKTNATHFFSLRDVAPHINLDILRKIPQYFVDPNAEFGLDPSFEHTNVNGVYPYAIKNNVDVFNNLQKMAGIGLVIPCDEEHMYYAAMNSKSCKLTTTGQYYWKLVKCDII